MALVDRELAAFKFLDGLTAQLRHGREATQLLRLALRATREFFAAPQGCIAALQPDRRRLNLLVTQPRDASWDLDALSRFIRHERPPVQPHLLIGPVRRRAGAWGAMAVMRESRPFDHEDGRVLVRAAAILSDAIHAIDRERIRGVRDRIDRKCMEQLHPKDLFYQILAGLRSLTHYDHSSALFIRDEDDSALQLVAEQIAWKKAGSRRIGLRLPIRDADAAMLMSGRMFGFDRYEGRWQPWRNQPATRLAESLDEDSTEPIGEEEVRQNAIMCAPLVTRDGLVGLLKIAGRHVRQFGPYDAELVEHFRSQAALAIQSLSRTESLRSRVMIAERKHAMADLARSVAHDVNNALGAMLPLVQQLQEDHQGGRLAPAVLAEDLEQLQKSLQVCRRIFGGMLSFSRGAARRTGHAHVRRAVDTASAILKYGLGRSGIELAVDIPDDIPSVACSQVDLEQVFLNLLTNAREAMPQGGRIEIEARSAAHNVEIAVSDSGCGIPEEHLPRVIEPFFTTKAHGNGLGLSICRSILWEVDGTIAIRSAAGRGTRVDLALPHAIGQAQVQHA